MKNISICLLVLLAMVAETHASLVECVDDNNLALDDSASKFIRVACFEKDLQKGNLILGKSNVKAVMYMPFGVGSIPIALPTSLRWAPMILSPQNKSFEGNDANTFVKITTVKVDKRQALADFNALFDTSKDTVKRFLAAYDVTEDININTKSGIKIRVELFMANNGLAFGSISALSLDAGDKEIATPFFVDINEHAN